MSENISEKLSGSVESVVYYNEQTDYSVLEIAEDSGLLVTAVGKMSMPSEGERVTLSGRYTYHKEFGKQFSFESYDKTLPADKEGILLYLSSHTVKGVGPITAKKIVDYFGLESFDVIENHPEWLIDIPGITMKKAAVISESFREQNGLRSVIMFCKGYMDISEATRVYKSFGNGAVGIISENPYILCESDFGIPFSKADELADSIGFDKRSEHRIFSGIKCVLAQNAILNGHTCLPYKTLIEESAMLLSLECELIEEKTKDFISDGALSRYVIEDSDYIMTKETDEAEEYLAKRLIAIDKEAARFGIANISTLIERVEMSVGIKYAAMQKRAIHEALDGGVLILTGGPGTGKTTVVKALLSIFSSLGLKTVLAAPTGRAAKRLSETTGQEAKTVHRMLEVEKGTEESYIFSRNRKNPLREDVIILDEASMIDLSLMKSVVLAMKRGARLIIIGDADQLPSVGAGNILDDMIRSGRLTTVCLNEIFRQSKESLIITNAHRINSGAAPVLNSVEDDFFFIKRQYESEIPTLISDLITKRLPRKYGTEISERIQVITPSKKGACGVEAINAHLQEKINPPSVKKAERVAHGVTFREGDKVMQIVNNYDIEWKRGNSFGSGIFNGDIGVILKIDKEEGKMSVIFDERVAEYSFDMLDELDLSYAVTVHKSQGNEYPVVIIPLYHCSPKLLTRNLLYTAVTRARQMVIMVGCAEIVHQMVNNNEKAQRYTTLRKRLEDTAQS